METIAYSPQRGKTLSYLLAAIFLTVATGTVLSARASNRATWTGEAGNGLFQDSGNWTCFNESDEQVAGVPAADAAITLAADVPANGWVDANFAAMSGPIDLAGHSLTVPKTFFDGATPALTDLIVNGDFETDRLTDGKTSEKMLPTFGQEAPAMFMSLATIRPEHTTTISWTMDAMSLEIGGSRKLSLFPKMPSFRSRSTESV